MKELEEAHRIAIEKHLFSQGVRRSNQVLDINQKLSQVMFKLLVDI